MSETLATKMELESANTDQEVQITVAMDELKAKIESINRTLDELIHQMDTMPDRIALRLGAIMVTMTALLMAIGPFYIPWAMSIIGAG